MIPRYCKIGYSIFFNPYKELPDKKKWTKSSKYSTIEYTKKRIYTTKDSAIEAAKQLLKSGMYGDAFKITPVYTNTIEAEYVDNNFKEIPSQDGESSLLRDGICAML